MVFLAAMASAATLDEAWRAAEEAPELRAASAGSERAEATVGAARAALLPKLQVNARYTWNDQEVTLDPASFLPAEMLALAGPMDPFVVQQRDWVEASATVVQPILDADAIRTWGAARLAADAADADVDEARRRLRIGVARAFYGTARAREGVVVAEEAVRVAARMEEVARARVTVGDAPPRTALEAEQARLAAERDRLVAVEQRARAEEALHRLTGLPRDTPVDPAEIALPAEGRPDLRAARLRADAAQASQAAARLGWVPDVSGRVTGLVTENQGFAPDPYFVVAALEATWTFDGGYRSSRARDASAARVGAAAMAEALARGVEEEQRLAEAALERATAAATAARRELDAADARLREAELAFQQGLIPFTEVERAALARSAAAMAESGERLGAGLAEVELALARGE